MDVYPLLAKAPAFAGVETELLQRMARAASTRTLSRGQYLWHAGDQPRHLTLLRSGLIKIVRAAARGRSTICGLFGPPDTVGDLALIKGIAYPADAIVATETASVVEVPAALVVEAMAKSPKLCTSLACEVHTKLSSLHDKIDVLSAGAVEARLATLLIQLYQRFGDETDDGVSFIPVTLSRRELSDLVSTSFETGIRVMTRWEREGIVATESTGFVIHDMPALSAAAGVLSGAEGESEAGTGTGTVISLFSSLPPKARGLD
jgi:CRP/FNR family transcriptional regulator